MKPSPLVAVTLAAVLAAAWTVAQPQNPPVPHETPGVQGAPPQSPPDGKGLKRPLPHQGKDGKQARAREMLEQVMIARLSSELKLTDEQSVLLMRRFTESREAKQALGRERTEAMRKLRAVVAEQKDEAALNECLAHVRDIDTKLAAHRQQLQETMGAELSPWQKGKLVLFLDQFESDLKQMLRDARERRNDRPMGPMDGMPPHAPGMMPPGMPPGMPPHGLGRGPMQPGMPPGGPNGPAGMRPPQGPPHGPPEAPPQDPPPQIPPPPAPAK